MTNTKAGETSIVYMQDVPKANWSLTFKQLKIKFPNFSTFISSYHKKSQYKTESKIVPEEILSCQCSSAPIEKKHFKLVTHSNMTPHPHKKSKGGEDALFISADSRALGIADGVGGWADKGIDPSLYSRTLMSEAKFAYDQLFLREPVSILESATKKANTVHGSSTACIVLVEDRGQQVYMRSANIGDSGFMVIRNGNIVYRSKEQQFSFNFPYQLGATTRATPRHADIYDFELLEGDIILLATDGLYDNLFPEDILSIILKNPLSSVADELARKAFDVSKSTTAETPFSVNSIINGCNYPGGKMDDISIIVAQVTSIAESESKDETLNL